MSASDAGDVTTLLREWSGGSKSALDELAPLIYAELHKIARFKLGSERADHTLQPTALIHEAYLRLVRQDQPAWHSRTHFFAVASHLMRQILVDHARRHRAAKRGAGEKVALDEAISFAPERGQELLDLDEALRRFEQFDPRKCRLIELKYFGGLSGQEIADALGLSISTVVRDSRLAEAWLHAALKQPAGPALRATHGS